MGRLGLMGACLQEPHMIHLGIHLRNVETKASEENFKTTQKDTKLQNKGEDSPILDPVAQNTGTSFSQSPFIWLKRDKQEAQGSFVHCQLDAQL